MPAYQQGYAPPPQQQQQQAYYPPPPPQGQPQQQQQQPQLHQPQPQHLQQQVPQQLQLQQQQQQQQYLMQQQQQPQQQQHGYAPPPQQGVAPPQQQQQQPPPQQQQQIAAPIVAAASDQGQFPGGNYSITHRDTNAVLNINLQQGATVRSKTGAMIHMSASVQLTGKVQFSMKKLLTGGALAESTYVGPGSVAVGPTLFGDIITLHVDGRQPWTIGRDAYLACTPEITRETKTQGFSKTLFSGEDLFVTRIGGQGILWLTSFGAVDRLDLQPGQQHIVDNGHLVAWSCDYRIEKAGGGAMAGMKTGEGLVCRFTGPGSVYVQTRNMDEFQTFIRSLATAGGGGGGSLLGL